MKHYYHVTLVVNGNETAQLQIWGEHNTFSVFEYEENVFVGNWLKAKAFIDEWKNNKQPIIDVFKSNGMDVNFVETFK